MSTNTDAAGTEQSLITIWDNKDSELSGAGVVEEVKTATRKVEGSDYKEMVDNRNFDGPA